jgi:hypothetical protein
MNAAALGLSVWVVSDRREETTETEDALVEPLRDLVFSGDNYGGRIGRLRNDPESICDS